MAFRSTIGTWVLGFHVPWWNHPGFHCIASGKVLSYNNRYRVWWICELFRGILHRYRSLHTEKMSDETQGLNLFCNSTTAKLIMNFIRRLRHYYLSRIESVIQLLIGHAFFSPVRRSISRSLTIAVCLPLPWKAYPRRVAFCREKRVHKWVPKCRSRLISCSGYLLDKTKAQTNQLIVVGGEHRREPSSGW